MIHISVGLVKKGKYLVFQRRGKSPYKNYLGLMGGKIEVGEGPDQALVREVREESGLEVKEISYQGDILEVLIRDKEVFGVRLSIYSALAEGEIKSNKAEGEIRLIYQDKLPQSKNKFIPTDWMVINRLIKNKLSSLQNDIIYVIEKNNKYEVIFNDL